MTPRTYGVTVRRSVPLRLPMHRDAPSHVEWARWLRRSERPIAIDLFSGAGGLSQGLEAAGYRVALSVDQDEWALETHAHNFEGLALRLDLASEEVRDEIVGLFDGVAVDLVAGGPPCQPFSRAGRSKIRSLVDLGVRDAVDVRKELWRAFLDIVDRVRPRAVLMENVPDMALGDDTLTLRLMMAHLEASGYEVDARIVDTWLHGVPQHRQRLILVGVRDGGSFEWPAPADRVTVRDAIGDLPALAVEPDTAIGAETMAYNDHGMSDFARRARKGCVEPVVHDHVTRAVRADDHQAFQLMTAGTLYSDLPDDVKRYRDDIFDDKYNRLDWDDFSRSITAHIAKDGYWYIHPEQHRTLTVREAARIQTFPDGFRFAGSRSHQFQQIGNAVPPALGEAIGVALLDATRSTAQTVQTRSQQRAAFRAGLLGWADEDSQEAPWAYPGDPWPVVVGLLVGAYTATDWPNPADVLRLAPSFANATPRFFTMLLTMTEPGRRRTAVERLAIAATAARNDPEGWDGSAWRSAVKLGPADARWYQVRTGDALTLAASTSVLRVTARVTGTDVDRQNRNSAGRMELAKLVGAGTDAPRIHSAMHRLGQVICTTQQSACHGCPVRDSCTTASAS